ncbi:MAG: recombination-associated protein RdgC [Gammaproteobacteria bacterium]|nr:recombination-associated protein RdgC [Gammaproteobacteria bacterium]
MWFKNVRAYRLTGPFELTPEQMQEQMEASLYRPCGKTQPLALGWVPPLGGETQALVHAVNRRFLLCARREEKLLPATVVREQLAEKVEQIEQEQGRKVYRKERLNLKEEIVQDCLPRAFSRSVLIYAYIDTRANWLFVDSASANRAEELLNLLRECIGSLPLLLLPQVNQSPAATMTHWLQNRTLPQDLELAQDCELRDPTEDGGVVRCRGIELSGDEVDVHLQAGKQVVRLALLWDEKLSMVLAEDLCIRRLRFADELMAENEDLPEADTAAHLDADFALMSEVLTGLQERLLSWFGGEAAA